MLNRANSLKEMAIRNRCNFISYGVISPYLAEAQKHVFLGKGKWYLLWHSNQKEIRKAVINVATAANKQWLYESDWEIRSQFLNLMKAMKKECNKREWEEFLTEATLRDSLDDTKHRGAQSWWTTED